MFNLRQQHVGIVPQDFINIFEIEGIAYTSVNRKSIDTVALKLHPTALLVAWAQ